MIDNNAVAQTYISRHCTTELYYFLNQWKRKIEKHFQKKFQLAT